MKELLIIFNESKDLNEQHKARKAIERIITNARLYKSDKQKDLEYANEVIDIMNSIVDISKSIINK